MYLRESFRCFFIRRRVHRIYIFVSFDKDKIIRRSRKSTYVPPSHLYDLFEKENLIPYIAEEIRDCWRFYNYAIHFLQKC